jgi:peptidylprolyl isomerase
MHSNSKASFVFVLGLLLGSAAAAHEAAPGPAPTMTELLAASSPADWHTLDPENTLYMELASGRVVIELAPAFAPLHVANIRALVRAGYFNGLSIVRVQDDYVVQWGDPEAVRAIPGDIQKVAAEFDAQIDPRNDFTRLPDGDVYAPLVGFSSGFPAARDPKLGRTWLVHCYGMVGVARGDDTQSSGAELYAVIGHAPRHLDRNVALVGRVVKGIDELSSLPRGNAEMGFYSKAQTTMPIKTIELAADLAPALRSNLEILRTDSRLFTSVIEARRNRPEQWFKVKAGHIDICNVPIPVREISASSAQSLR